MTAAVVFFRIVNGDQTQGADAAAATFRPACCQTGASPRTMRRGPLNWGSCKRPTSLRLLATWRDILLAQTVWRSLPMPILRAVRSGEDYTRMGMRRCNAPRLFPLSSSLSVAAILADASIRMVALSCLGRMLFWSSVYRAQKMLQSPPLMLYSTSRRRDHPPLRLDVARKMCRRHTNAAKATPRLIKQWCAKDSIYHINRPIALYPQPHAGRLGMCSRNHAFGLPPNPGTPVHLWPAGILGRPKFSSRSRMTLRAFRLRRYGSGAFASARPTDGSRLASPWSLPGSGSAFDASVPSSE
jgi:hypothetical protein